MRTLVAADFIASESPAALAANEIHLWFFPQCGASGDQQHCLRDLLAAYLHAEAHGWRIERDVRGKPFIAGLPDDASLQFNLAHSGPALLVGISRNQALGVDVELGQRTRPWLALAQRYFSADETAALAALPPARQAPAFLDVWSCKEAVLKALGRGIAFGLHRLVFALDNDGAVTRLARIDDEAGGLEQWQVLRIRPADGTCGALAWHGPAHRVRAFRSAFESTRR